MSPTKTKHAATSAVTRVADGSGLAECISCGRGGQLGSVGRGDRRAARGLDDARGDLLRLRLWKAGGDESLSDREEARWASIAPRIAIPRAEPTWREVLWVPEPWPDWSRGTSVRMTPVSWAVANPTPKP